MRWYHVFAFLWVSQFILACQDVTIAGAVAEWYFTRSALHQDIKASLKTLETLVHILQCLNFIL
ncbi:Choline transporter-like protein 1 [Portunus trituberculatus]|uniref:Choline transporter-like protein n=1 Tax=Portunus trituberculatus TaxID=210409 RepID=A0A5B7JZQ2_PORTR|nr:Choline transporter-like protein 1 [Portunus trituberculatus]